jgi:antitoxin component of MazEF toxin-antitoxin module
MATIRKIYSTGGATVVGIPPAYQELTGLVPGSEARIEVRTPKKLLLEMGVADGVVGAMDLSDEYFMVVRLHYEEEAIKER